MDGLSLKTFQLDLHKVQPDSERPATTIDWEQKMKPFADKIENWYGDNFDFPTKYHNLSLDMLAGFSFDEVCKLRYSSIIMMDSTVEDLFTKNPEYEIVRKINSSMWRWSFSKGTWNETVDAYNNIRNFIFIEDEDFEVRLDYSTGSNECGYAKYSRTFLDGVFGFLVYYKSKHVLTIGFSIIEGRRILIQQVQSAQRSGNRALYKLPHNKLEFVISRFQQYFPGYQFYVIDGCALVEKIISNYQTALDSNIESCKRNSNSGDFLQELKERQHKLVEQLEHLKAQKPRLINFYKSTGAYKLGDNKLVKMKLPHYPIIVPPKSLTKRVVTA